MQNLFDKIIVGIVSLGIAIGGFFGINNEQPIVQQPEVTLGSGVTPIAGTTYNLSGSGVSSSATSIVLQSLTLPQTGYEILDADLSDTFYITIEPGSRTKQEVASCTTVTQNANNTATLSGCTRGLKPISPYTADTNYAFTHAGGVQVIFSNPPQEQNQYAAKANNETITGTWTFSSFPIASATSTASTTNAGIVEMATAAEASAGTDLGATGAHLSLGANLATSTCQGVASSVLVASSTTGKLAPTCFDQTANYTLTGTNTFSGSNTFASSTFTATTSFNSAIFVNGTSSTPIARTYTSSNSWSKPSGLKYIVVEVVGGGGGGAGEDAANAVGGGGGGGGYAREILDSTELSATSTITVTVGASGAGGTGGGTETGSTGGTTSFSSFLSATGGAGGNLGDGGAGGSGTGGDLNVAGSGGGGGSGGTANAGQASGAGGGSVLGGGAAGNDSGDGIAGVNYGGGGSGAKGSGNGGAGAAGVIIVTEYYL